MLKHTHSKKIHADTSKHGSSYRPPYPHTGLFSGHWPLKGLTIPWLMAVTHRPPWSLPWHFESCSDNPQDQACPAGQGSLVKCFCAFSLCHIKSRDFPRRTGCNFSFLFPAGSLHGLEQVAPASSSSSEGLRVVTAVPPPSLCPRARMETGGFILGRDCSQ